MFTEFSSCKLSRGSKEKLTPPSEKLWIIKVWKMDEESQILKLCAAKKKNKSAKWNKIPNLINP